MELDSTSSGGARTLAPADVRAVEWLPAVGLENGYLRFRVAVGAPASPPAPEYDPYAVKLYGFRKDPLMALGELHRSGVLTDEEFSTAKRAVLQQL